jgi:hypothetical protein
MKITKIAEGWPSRNAASESGSQASGGTVRSTWKIGSSPRIAHSRLADQRAERDTGGCGERITERDALQAGGQMQNRPPVDAAAIEERIDDQFQVSFSTRDGGGRVAPGRLAEHFPDHQRQRENDQRRNDPHRDRGCMREQVVRRSAGASARRGPVTFALTAGAGSATAVSDFFQRHVHA